MLKQGIYEKIINQKLKSNLQDISLEAFNIGKEKIDVEEARKLLSSYISQVTRRALNYVRDNFSDDKEALLNQIRTCNDIISTLHKNLDDDEFGKLKIAEEGEVLTSVYSRLNSIRSHQQRKTSKTSNTSIPKFTIHWIKLRAKHDERAAKRDTFL